MQTKGGNFMSKIANLQIGEYDLTLEVSRTILMDAFAKHPQMSNSIAKGEEISITNAYDFCKTALLYMAKAQDKDFTKKKANEIFDYAEQCVVDDEDENGNQIEIVATDYLVKKIMELVNLGFTKSDNAKKIKITLS